jgi:hypothetical protein
MQLSQDLVEWLGSEVSGVGHCGVCYRKLAAALLQSTRMKVGTPVWSTNNFRMLSFGISHSSLALILNYCNYEFYVAKLTNSTRLRKTNF